MPQPASPAGDGARRGSGPTGWAWPAPGRIEAENPPRGRFVSLRDLSVHYVEMGRPEAPAVVLLHGASGNLNDMTFDLARRLAEHHRVVAFDRPGLGYTGRPEEGWRPEVQARVLQQAASALHIVRPVVLGHSWGAAAALAWALLAPAQTRGLVIVSGATRPWGGGPGPLSALKTSAAVSAATAAVLYNLALRDGGRAAAARIFRPQAAPEGYLEHLQPALLARPASFRANMQDVEHLGPELARMAPRYPELDRPVEILHGAADSITPPPIHAKGLAETLPRARLHLFEGVGHMLHHARPEATADAVRRLTGVRPA